MDHRDERDAFHDEFADHGRSGVWARSRPGARTDGPMASACRKASAGSSFWPVGSRCTSDGRPIDRPDAGMPTVLIEGRGSGCSSA